MHNRYDLVFCWAKCRTGGPRYAHAGDGSIDRDPHAKKAKQFLVPTSMSVPPRRPRHGMPPGVDRADLPLPVAGTGKDGLSRTR